MTHKVAPPEDRLHVAIVIPCLNEEQTLADTCASLGFGLGNSSYSTGNLLFLVDNGSTDSTVDVAHRIKSASKDDSVFIGHAPQRGFVPARHFGNQMVEEVVRSMNWDLQDVLILQVDADTHYTPGYVTSMQCAAEKCGPGVMIEACVTYPPTFKSEYSDYIQICDDIDSEFLHLFPRDITDDDLVDDKVSGYRLSDYFDWGGHRREYTTSGEEIHSETARLYMRARATDARRERVESAQAFHSPRRILEDPALHLAAAGFPREGTWNAQWRQMYTGPMNLRDLCSQPQHPEVLKAIRMREQHILALLGVLPMHVDRALNVVSSVATNDFAHVVLAWLPERVKNDLIDHPGVFLTDVFELIHKRGDALIAEARESAPRKNPRDPIIPSGS